MKVSKKNGWVIWKSVIWTKRLWEFGKPHVDIGLAAGPQIASSGFYRSSHSQMLQCIFQHSSQGRASVPTYSIFHLSHLPCTLVVVWMVEYIYPDASCCTMSTKMSELIYPLAVNIEEAMA